MQDNLGTLPAQSGVGTDRRREVRHTASGTVGLYEVGRTPRRFLGCGVLRDLSKSGFCAQMEQRLAVGTIVELTGCGERMRAICRHTSAGFVGFIMGFEFLDAANGSDRSSLPATW